MTNYNSYISRSDASAAIPEEMSNELVTGLAKSSAALALGHQVPMSVLNQYIPSVSSLPQAYWNVPDATPSSLLQTTHMTVALNEITAYELGTIVPIPKNVIDDSINQGIDIFATLVKPRAVEAMAKQLDNAVIWGVGRPSGSNLSVLETVAANSGGRVAYGDGTTSSSTTVTDTSASAADVGKAVFGPGIPSGATVASQSTGVSITLSAAATATGSVNLLLVPTTAPYVVAADIFASGHDSAADILQAAMLVDQCGYSPSAAWTAPGWQYRNMAARTQQLVANPVGSDAIPLLLGGLPISPFAGSRAGGPSAGAGPVWNRLADAVVGDWSQLKIGVRKDVTIDMFDTGVVNDGSGVIQLNLMQTNSIAMRLTARYSWVVVAPQVADDSFTGGTRSGFSIVTNSGAHTGPVGVASEDTRPQLPVTIPALSTDGDRDGTARPRSGKR
jgi:hypothetical protein